MGSFSLIHWLIFLGIAYLLFKVIRGSVGNKGTISKTGSMICQNCGTQGEPKTITKGSLAIEIVLWLCFLIPGIIYSLWRMTTKQQGCLSCGLPEMIKTNSPNGKLLIKKFADVTE